MAKDEDGPEAKPPARARGHDRPPSCEKGSSPVFQFALLPLRRSMADQERRIALRPYSGCGPHVFDARSLPAPLHCVAD